MKVKPSDVLTFLAFILGIIVIIWFIVSCHDGCETEETRCKDNRVEICDGDSDWGLVENCSNVIPGEWTCCEYLDTHICLPVEECNEMSNTQN